MKFLLQICIITSLLITNTLFCLEPSNNLTESSYFKLTKKELRKFAGIYRNENGDVIRIKRQDEKLYAYTFLAEKWELKPVSATVFNQEKTSPANYLQFYLVKGKVKGYLALNHKKNRAMKFVKVGHFSFYKRTYLVVLSGLAILLFLLLMRLKGYGAETEDQLNYLKWITRSR